MAKYTEEQLLQIKDETTYVPQPTILAAFNELIDQVKEHAREQQQAEHARKWHNGDTYIDDRGNERTYHHMNRRRGSRSGQQKPYLKKKNEVIKDEDGWETAVPVTGAHNNHRSGSFGGADNDANDDRNKFRETIGVRAKPNNKNLGSSKAVDPREIASDKQTKTFNAFEALEGDNDDDDE
ncbi:CAF20 [Candida margitis]|uniref:CAF20 n=1 Tax=Candida margitis TaxID=1775924 RepID=UPI002226CF16|nr:CAF20 [Candida margitis]KAI5950428.1 CAF20 [Candida margitis]